MKMLDSLKWTETDSSEACFIHLFDEFTQYKCIQWPPHPTPKKKNGLQLKFSF